MLKFYQTAAKRQTGLGVKTQKEKEQSGAITRIESINVISERDSICPLLPVG